MALFTIYVVRSKCKLCEDKNVMAVDLTDLKERHFIIEL